TSTWPDASLIMTCRRVSERLQRHPAPSRGVRTGCLPGEPRHGREHDHLDVAEAARRVVGVARRVWILSTAAKRSVPWTSHARTPRVRGAPAAGRPHSTVRAGPSRVDRSGGGGRPPPPPPPPPRPGPRAAPPGPPA